MAKRAELEPRQPGSSSCHQDKGRKFHYVTFHKRETATISPVNTALTLLWCISSTSNQYGSGETAEALQPERHQSAELRSSVVIEMTWLGASTLSAPITSNKYMYSTVCLCKAHSHCAVTLGEHQKSGIFKFSYHIFTCIYLLPSLYFLPSKLLKGKKGFFFLSSFEKEKYVLLFF